MTISTKIHDLNLCWINICRRKKYDKSTIMDPKSYSFFRNRIMVFMRLMKSRDQTHTTSAKISAMPNCDPPKPCWKPMATARAATVAEWDEGMPPEPTSCLKSQLFSLYLEDYYGRKTIIARTCRRLCVRSLLVLASYSYTFMHIITQQYQWN